MDPLEVEDVEESVDVAPIFHTIRALPTDLLVNCASSPATLQLGATAGLTTPISVHLLLPRLFSLPLPHNLT